MHLPSYLAVCKELIRTDLFIFKNDLFGRSIDLIIWVSLQLGIVTYVMPYFGLSSTFGTFQFGGILAATALFELYGNVVNIISDFQGNRVIDYQLTLPVSSRAVLISRMISYALSYIIITLIMLPVGKLLLWYQFDLTQVSWFKLILAILAQGMFYASFVFFPASLVLNLSQMRTVWSRFIFPMWFLGGFQFSWKALHTVLPLAAYAVLANPLIYITESMRIALIGQEGFINFWICMAALCSFSALFAWLSLHFLQKRLDYV